MGKLYLLPNLLYEDQKVDLFLPSSVALAVSSLDGLIAESEKMARRYLRKFLPHEKMAEMPIALLNEHTKEFDPIMEPLKRNETWGLISDAGLPCIADPGAKIVELAHLIGIQVETLPGPSSIFMALQLSGFSGQHFQFHGYLPKETLELTQKLKELEKAKGTQIWIEAPYRSQKMFDFALEVLRPETKLCIAASLTTEQQRVIPKKISAWKKEGLVLSKEPVVFLIKPG